MFGAGLLALGLYSGDANAEKTPEIKRNYAGFDVNYSLLNLNHVNNEDGISFGVEAGYRGKVKDWLDLGFTLDFNHASLSSLEESLTDNVTEMDVSLDGTTNLYSGKELDVNLTVSAKYLVNHEAMRFSNHEGHVTKHTAGPGIVLELESKHVDVALGGYVLFGEKDSSYDVNRSMHLEHVFLTFTPRVWRMEFPLEIEYLHWAPFQKPVDRANKMLRLSTKPSIDLSKHSAMYINVSLSCVEGEEDYYIVEAGGGFKLKW